MYNPTKKQIMERWNSMPDILKEAMHSAIIMDASDSIEINFHLDEVKGIKLSKLIRGVFYGLIHVQDLYNEIKDSLGIDPRLALDIYHEIDKKIFESFRKDIEDFYIRNKIGIIKESQITQTGPIESQIVLKNGPEIINLKPEGVVEMQTKKLVVQSPEQPKKEPSTIFANPVQNQNQLSQSQIGGGSVAPILPQSSPTGFDGPIIIHKKEEAQSVSQGNITNAYKQTSLGGFMGSFGAIGAAKHKDQGSLAKVEMPFQIKSNLQSTEQKIPVVVKKYGEQVKTVHYSDLKTSLEPKTNNPPKSEPPKENGFVNLNDLTINK
ncbi:MAG TPA: hypothetical protein PK367_00145 [Candidatus Paceibacterota bacterium]|mgnify:CR=1 FL=1|nr:hypothetical protein [Candidatus Paceibacterota bacterium]